MVTTTEGVFTVEGVELYTKTWTVRFSYAFLPPSFTQRQADSATDASSQPSGPIKARLIMVHGFSDHINIYNPFFPKIGRAHV